MLFRILIVDDEAPMRKGLSSFINWDAIDCKVVDTACDGADAIEKIKNNDVDIIITDVKMPEMDGLELARYIYENQLHIAIIILTGYAEFEYAQTAIRYNVSQFLLKPTSKEEIISAVKTAQQKNIISKKQDFIAKNELAFLKEQLLQELTYCTPTEEIKKKLEEYNFNLDCYFIAAFQLSSAPSDLNQLKELIIQQKSNSYCFRYNNLILSIYYHKELSSVIDNCNEICTILNSLYSFNISIGISEQHYGVDEFSTASFEAIHSLSLVFYTTSRIAVFDSQNIQSENALPVEVSFILYELETAIIQRDFNKASSITASLFIKLQSNFINAADAKNICSHIYYLAYRVMAKYQMVLPSEDFLTQIQLALHVFRLEEIIQELLQYIKQAFLTSSKKHSPYIMDTISYIKNHLSENITLENIARYVHINESYLSRTFKKECGYSITEYITTLRIERAKELLSNTTVLTYEISEQVGIHDPSYFSLLFKKHTGLSPTEYRNQFIMIEP